MDRMASPGSYIHQLSGIRRPPRAEAVLKGVAVEFQLPIAEIVAGRQFKKNVAARREACRRLRAIGYSLGQIGTYMGGLHHTTILHHVRDVVVELETPAPIPDLSGEWAI